MHPIICQIGSFTVFSYGLMLVVAFSVAAALVGRQARKEGIDPDIIFNLLFIAFIAGILGARILYVAENLSYYLQEPWEIMALQHGGLSWFGGLLLGFCSSVVYLKIKKLDLLKVLDLIVPFLALAQAIGRIGCLLNGCCFGKPAQNFGLYFKAHNAVLIPTQLYSSLSLLLIFFILRYLQDKPHWQGKVFFCYLVLYSLKRFFIEFWRADNPGIFLHLTLFQLFSAVVFFIGLIFLIIKGQRHN